MLHLLRAKIDYIEKEKLFPAKCHTIMMTVATGNEASAMVTIFFDPESVL